MFLWRCRRAIVRAENLTVATGADSLNPGRHGEVAGAVVGTGYIAVVPRVVHAIFVVAQYFVVEAELIFVLTADFGNQYGFGAFELEGGRNRYVLVHYVGVAAGEKPELGVAVMVRVVPSSIWVFSPGLRATSPFITVRVPFSTASGKVTV